MEKVRECLELGAEVNTKDNNGWTPLVRIFIIKVCIRLYNCQHDRIRSVCSRKILGNLLKLRFKALCVRHCAFILLTLSTLNS